MTRIIHVMGKMLIKMKSIPGNYIHESMEHVSGLYRRYACNIYTSSEMPVGLHFLYMSSIKFSVHCKKWLVLPSSALKPGKLEMQHTK